MTRPASETAPLQPTRDRASISTWGVAASLILILALLPPISIFAGGKYLLVVGERVIIFAIAALALDLIVGYGAMISMGFATSLGVGAYAAGILASHGFNQAEIGLPAAMFASFIFALATGAVAVRTKGAYFIMITLAFGQMAYFVATSLAPYGGDDGLTLQARSTVFGAPLFQERDDLLLRAVGMSGGHVCFFAGRDRLALRPGVARLETKPRAHARHRFQSLSLPADRVLHRWRPSVVSPASCCSIRPSSWPLPTCPGSVQASCWSWC